MCGLHNMDSRGPGYSDKLLYPIHSYIIYDADVNLLALNAI